MCQAEYANFVRENVSSRSLCQVENERFGRNSLSKSEKVSNRTDLKTNFLNTCQTAKTYQKAKLSKSAETVEIEKLSQTENVSSDDRILAVT
jgi:hypothetical protein